MKRFQTAKYESFVYCKHGYFRWGKISRKCWQDISRWGNFQDTTPISFIKAYGFYFCMGVIFMKKTKARKMQKLPPRKNFHVYRTWKSCLQMYLTAKHFCGDKTLDILKRLHFHESLVITFLRLWSEILLFHKLIYDIAPGSILLGWDVAVLLLCNRKHNDVDSFSAVKLVIKLYKSVFFLHFSSLTCNKKNLKWISISYGIYVTCVYIPLPKAWGYKNIQFIS